MRTRREILLDIKASLDEKTLPKEITKVLRMRSLREWLIDILVELRERTYG